MGTPAPGKAELNMGGWLVRDHFPDGIAPVSKILFDSAGTGTGIAFADSTFTTGIDMASATINGDDIVLSATGVINAETSVGIEIGSTSKLAVTATTITLTGSTSITATTGTLTVQPAADGDAVINLKADADAHLTITQTNGGAVTFLSTSNGTAGFLFDGGPLTLDKDATIDNTTAADVLTIEEATLTMDAETLFSVESGDIRLGFDDGAYMKLAVTDTTGVTAVTFTGNGPTYTLTAPTMTFAGATKINLDGPTDVTGILTIDTAGSPADGIKINATTPTDGLEIASACGTHAINISAAQTGAGITIASTCGTYGLNIAGACTSAGINIGTNTYGILMEGEYTNGIRLTTTVDTTNHTGIRVLDTYTAGTGYHTAVMGAAIYDPTTPGYGAVIGVFGEANINGEFTGGTNWSFGVRGTLQLRDDTVINNGSSIFGAINASMKDDPTPTLTAGHICGIYIENLIDADLSAINGIATMLYVANNSSATCTLDSAIYLYGPEITYFTQFATACNSGGCISSGAPSAAATRYIRVEIEGAEYKITAESTA